LDLDLEPNNASLEESSSPSPLDFKLNLPILDSMRNSVVVKESQKLGQDGGSLVGLESVYRCELMYLDGLDRVILPRAAVPTSLVHKSLGRYVGYHI
jgi:hypothetical protein